jgi:hypothetical protein
MNLTLACFVPTCCFLTGCIISEVVVAFGNGNNFCDDLTMLSGLKLKKNIYFPFSENVNALSV